MSESTMEHGVVVAGYDGSGSAALATLWAAAEADSRGHHLLIVAAAGWPTLPEPALTPPIWPTPLAHITADAITLAHAETHLAAIAHECQRLHPHLHVQTHIVFGHPTEALCRAAADAHLLVIGPPTTSRPRLTARGATATQLVRRCDRPIVIVRNSTWHAGAPAPVDGGHVVVGVDQSSIRATRFAYAYAAQHHCTLIAVHAWPAPRAKTPTNLRRDWHNEWEHAEWLLTQLLADHFARYPGVPVHRVVTQDQPTRALRRHADGATLLVIGHHTHPTPHHPTTTSISNTLIHHPPCPLAVLRDTPPTTLRARAHPCHLGP